MRKVTKFYELKIVHPHSGEVSRTVIGTLLIHRAGIYSTGFTDHRTRNDRAKEAAAYLASVYPGRLVHLEDVNYNIQINGVY